MMASLLVRGERVVLPSGMQAASIQIHDGRVIGIGPFNSDVAGVSVLNAAEAIVLPGLVDTHVHINEPGRTDWEGFDTATRAAAAGGVTTLVDMPLNSIPATTTVPGLDAKRQAATNKCHVDVGFWGGVVPGNTLDLEPLVEAGVLGFKCFLSPSGVDEFPYVSERDLREALPVLARLGIPLLAHAEWPPLLRHPHSPVMRAYDTWLRSRPPESEHAAIELLIQLAREFRARVHIVHLASADALQSIAAARRDGIPLTVETCPHYLSFAAETIPDAAPTFKCVPPIRAARHRDGLWQGLADGHIDLIVTDHSPAPPSVKRLADGDFVSAWGGIASLQLGLAAVWTAARPRAISIESVVRWMSAAPARLAGLSHAKGSIAVGCDADLVIWDPDEEVTVDAATLYHRHPITPYDGARLRGRVRTTILRGLVVYNEGECAGRASGHLLDTRHTEHS